MEFGVLGPLLVRLPAGQVILPAAKQRALLAVLLLEAAHDVVPATRLIDELWGPDPPATAEKALQMHVSKLRRALARVQEEPVVTLPNGYAIRINPEAVDAHRFEALLSRGRQLRGGGDVIGALEAFRQALSLWRGPALADVILLGPAASEAERLEGLRALAQEERIELELEQGNADALVGQLEALTYAHPYRERMHGLLMLALYRSGRQADALAVFRRVRTSLVEDLGLEPGPELARLQDAILAQDPALDAPASAPPSPARAASVAAVPRAPSSILGREAELDAALDLIERDDVPLVTLSGPGGIGKTRLALELAARLGPRSVVVELAAIRDHTRVVPAIATATGAHESSEEAIASALTGERVVLFLDNFEQVMAAAGVVALLLRAIPLLTIVVTSRAPLRIAGEHELPLPPLARDPAVQLFVQRAQAQNPRFSPSSDELRCIEIICDRIDGLPLAIELAAARTRVLAPREMLERIGRRLDLLTGGRRDAPERHRTLRATIAWSYDLLDREERQLFEQLAVFHSGWSLEAAEAVIDGDVLDRLAALVDHALVFRDGARFRMLETVREYAVERLEVSAAAVAVRRRHARWCLALAEAAEPNLEGPQQESWFARLDGEQENLRAAAAWSAKHGEPEITLGLDGRLWRFWLARGAAAEAHDALSSALAAGQGDPPLRAKALNAAGVLAGEAGDVAASQVSFEQSLELAAEHGDRRQMARALANLGMIAMFTKDYATALRRYGDAAEIWRELGNLRGQSMMLQNAAVVHELMGELDEAMAPLEESVELARAAGDRMHVAATVITLAHLLTLRQVEDPRIPALLREGLAVAGALGERLHTIECLEVTAGFTARTGEPETGAELLGAAEAERQRARTQRKPDETLFVAETVQMLERILGHEAFERGRARGDGMNLDAAVALALSATEREREVT